MNQPQVVVGIDGSASSERALLWAAREAERRHANLVLAYAGNRTTWPPSEEPAAGALIETATGTDPELPSASSDWPHNGTRQHIDAAEALLDDATAMVLDEAFTGEIHTVLQDEPAVALLTQLGSQAALVVVGAHGLGRTGGTLLGSVAYRVAAQSVCPVAVVGEPASPSTTQDLPVGVGTSVSLGARPALEFAFAEAALRGVPLNAIHSWAELDWSVSGVRALYTTAAEFALRQQQFLRKLLSPIRARYPQVQLTITLTGDPVGPALAEASRRCSVLVVGCRRDGSRLLSRLGPTSSRLVHVAACPLIVVGRNPLGATTSAAARRLSHAR